MAELEQVLTERLAARAAHVDLASDPADLDGRIARSERRHDTVRNTLSVAGAALIVVLVVAIANVVTSSSPSVQTRFTPAAAATVPAVVADPTLARFAIASAYATVFQPGPTDAQRLRLIDDPTDLQRMIDALRSYASQQALDTVRVHVDRITFTDATHASTAFTIRSTQQLSFDGVMNKTGGAIYADGRWKLTRASFCAVMTEAGKATHDVHVYCPEDAPASK